MKKREIIILIIIVIVVLISYYGFNRKQITNFEECIAAGNPAMESYPRQCRDPISGKTFVEEIDDKWRLDDIKLMRHETEGFFGCFGCSTPKEGKALCVDPVPEMKLVEETEDRYCSPEFEVVG